MKGVSLIEVIIGAAIISSVLLALGSIAQFSLHATEGSSLKLRAVFIASEGIEAVKTLRNSNWATQIAPLTPGADYYIVFNTDHYEITSTPQALIDGIYQRRIVIEDVYRDVNFDIASSGTADTDTKKTSVYVSWTHQNLPKEEVMRTYITNL